MNPTPVRNARDGWSSEIKPSRIGFEVRTFQGVNCDHVYKLESATESMKCLPGLELYKSQKG